jgi:hypothetical protein
MFLLRPCKAVEQIYWYCLAVAAERFDIDILWTMVMSNHVHTGLYDRHGNYPAFLCYLHGLLARALNAHWGRWENFWATEPSSMVHLVDAADELRELVYSLVNPVQSHLVDAVTHWPGPNSLDAQLHDKTLTIKRPILRRPDGSHEFFAPDGAMPDTVTLRFGRPPGFRHLTQRQWTDLVRAEIAKEERRFAAEREAAGIRVLGRKAIRRQDAFHTPTTHEPRRELSPRVACKSKWHRIEQLRRNVEFQRAYREAFERRRGGDVDVSSPTPPTSTASSAWSVARPRPTDAAAPAQARRPATRADAQSRPPLEMAPISPSRARRRSPKSPSDTRPRALTPRQSCLNHLDQRLPSVGVDPGLARCAPAPRTPGGRTPGAPTPGGRTPTAA